ncbi:MAG: carboxypeptidase M32 [Bauldia sp.]|nr:carboxypeptidase M32 [Bauldia sp.]
MSPYTRLEAAFARAAILNETLGVLHWDTETMMPKGAIAGRSDQLATLEEMSHEIIAAPRVGEMLAEAEEGAAGLTEWQAANLREMRRAHVRAVAIPADLLVAATKANAVCQHVWQEARPANDFAAVKPHLAEVIRLQRAVGAALGASLDLSPYDALLDQYDPGARQDSIDALFAPLRAALPELIRAVVEKQRAAPAPEPLPKPFPVAAQQALCRMLLDTIGFDFDHGRLDVSAHPFSGGSFGDIRVTTRYSEDVLFPALFATIHEGGHALYEQGRPAAWRHQPVGLAKGMAVHESQSMIIEWQAGKSAEFLGFLFPKIREAFGGDGPAWSDGNLMALARRVEPGLIRVDADELTYPAHILVRFGIERALIAGELAVDDLPAAFNEAVAGLLGVTVPDDRRGCLQDIHWHGGAYGYFPMYLVGAMTAAQLFAAAVEADPALRPALAEGDFRPLVAWLRTHIHSRGSAVDRETLVCDATGAPTGADRFLTHLRARYLDS